MPHTLLLADDSVTIQRVIELTFADEDVTVIAVSDGDQAIERLDAAPPDIVLADIGMPGKNGYEVALYIRNSPKLAHIPVVLLTGAFEPVDQARADHAGCDGVLAKPFEPQQVIGRVKELLARPKRPAEVPVPMAESSSSPEPRSELADYFDRLDTAFSALSSNATAPPPIHRVPDSPATDVESDLDWFGSKSETTGAGEPWELPAPPADVSPVDLPLSHGSPQPEAAPAPPLEQEWFASLTEVDPVPQAVAVESATSTPEAVAPPVDAAPIPEPAPMVESEPAAEAAATIETEPAAEAAPMVEAEPAVASVSIEAPDERLAPIEESVPVEPADAEPPARHAAIAAVPPALELPLPHPPSLPPLADAFAALLAAEQGQPLPADAHLWPASAYSQAPPPAAVSEALIESVTRRVLERLSDAVVRDAVADIASKTAERLVREEIERIKASIK